MNTEKEKVQSVRECRELKNITISVLSKESGIAKSTLYDIETGRRNVKCAYAKKIAECLGVPIENMFYPTFYRTYINTE
ncbi:helix-turn-helix domain-containing protein [Bacillus sp. BPN334]|uniref:helix-turn-helix domain-containing protein n=1 Tax=Bacillus sp. BPN334 TaxID=2217815 RepID=UPI0011F0854C|nr:helix-turn-helix transcriptional regulator [Bacillus sp. BPN334]KAA0781297.1 XRE family transcriptional regulator [Bacillus sp. BPN334]